MSDDADKPQSLGQQTPGPTRIADPRLRHEAQRAAIWIGMAVLAGVIVYFSQPLMVIFGGIVFAAMLDGGARLLGRVLPVGRGVRITIVMVLALLFIGWTAYFAGNQIAAQAALFPALLLALFFAAFFLAALLAATFSTALPFALATPRRECFLRAFPGVEDEGADAPDDFDTEQPLWIHRVLQKAPSPEGEG